ncbi:MAG: PAS domain-containing sensor histidine kinase [Desulfuromonadia bacterium]
MATGHTTSTRSLPATWYAPPERLGVDLLTRQIREVSSHPLTDSLLSLMEGSIAILNEQRQVIAVNQSFLSLLGIDDPDQSLGLRPGEYVGCIHAHDMPGGCGTSRHCQTCGAVIALMASLSHDRSERNVCALQVKRQGGVRDLFFDVRSTPVRLGTNRFLLFSIRETTLLQERTTLDRSFFHDISNLLFALRGKVEILSTLPESEREARLAHLFSLVQRISSEISIHRALARSMDLSLTPSWEPVSIHELLEEQRAIFLDHELTRGKTLSVRLFPPDLTVRTDRHLASRVITNMVTNALEATADGGTVELFLEHDHPGVTVAVWNQAFIPEPLQLRIFQRNFSTKGETGRGFGTFSMKLFGERILGGSVTFSSSPSTGTIFRFSLPLHLSENAPSDTITNPLPATR